MTQTAMNLTDLRALLDKAIEEERQGPEAQRIPPHGETNSTNIRTNAEQPDTGDERESDKLPWAPYGFTWHTNQQTGQLYLLPTQEYQLAIIKGAEECFIDAIHKFRDSAECAGLIETLGNELRDTLQSRRAINDMSYSRVLKRECDDASYQIVQAAKYRIDAEEQMRQQIEWGETSKRKEKIETLRDYAKKSQREGYILSCALLKACESEKPPVFDYAAACRRTTEYSARKLTETLGARLKNERNAQKFDAAAFKQDLDNFWKD